MKERGIIMSAPMVRAILEDRKTQTRRIVKFDPLDPFDNPNCQENLARCPYGVAGDRLWVRETHYLWGRWIKNGKTKTGKQAWRFKRSGRAVIFDHNDTDEFSKGRETRHNGWVKRPSIHMPRWASRITLEITKVRVERLQDISDEDAIAEGIGKDDGAWRSYSRALARCVSPITSYRTLWDSLHGKGAWERNPWVWVLELRKL